MNTKPGEYTIGFEDLPNGSVEYKITVSMSADFKIRLWLIRKITVAYMAIVKILSKGVIKGSQE